MRSFVALHFSFGIFGKRSPCRSRNSKHVGFSAKRFAEAAGDARRVVEKATPEIDASQSKLASGSHHLPIIDMPQLCFMRDTARYKNSATGFDTDFPGFFGPEQKPSTPHVDTTSDAHQVQNRRRSLQSEKQSVAADRCLEPAADYLSQNGRDAGYTSPSQFEELGPCADC